MAKGPRRRRSSSHAARAGLSSLFALPTAEITERLAVLLEAEATPHYRCRDYLRDNRRRCASAASSSSSKRERVEPISRAKIVRWLQNIADYLALEQESVAVAMSCVDRFMSHALAADNNSTSCRANHRETADRALQDVTHYQLLAIASLLVAAKRDDKATAVDAAVLAKISHGSYSVREITEMERILLDALEWRLCGPTSLGVAHNLIALLGKVLKNKRRQKMASVVDFAGLQIELAAADYNLSVLRSPSVVAVAGVLNTLEFLDVSPKERRGFDRKLKSAGIDDLVGFFVGDSVVNSNEIEEARAELRSVFESQTSDATSRATSGTAVTEEENPFEKSFRTASTSRSPVGVGGLPSGSASRRWARRRDRNGRKNDASRRRPQAQLEP